VPKERIGWLGGTFNPVHNGHLRAAEEVRRRLGLGCILFVPSYLPPHKVSMEIASAEDRFAMVRLATQDQPAFEPSSIEIDVREKSYSIDTLNKIRSLHGDSWILFILGIDAFLAIETWKSYQELLERCRFVVMSRPGYRLEEARPALPAVYAESIFELAEGRPLAEDVLERCRVFLVAIDALGISSTDIRRRIAEGRPLAGLVPEAVESYIKVKRLYQE
jgi:nicotinate-nucleotide adenylyltransferase